MTFYRSQLNCVSKIKSLSEYLVNKSRNVLSTSNKKIAFVTANPYYETSYLKLGDPVCNDAILTAQFYSQHGYEVYSLIDPDKETFVYYLKQFTEMNLEDLIVYYGGHGGQVKDLDGDEIDGKDETWVFYNGNLVDDELHSIWDNNKCSNILVLSDSCHSGTIVETTRNNIISFTGCKDHQCSVQLKSNGMFTYYLFKFANNGATLSELQQKINNKICNFNQCSQLSKYTIDRKLFL